MRGGISRHAHRPDHPTAPAAVVAAADPAPHAAERLAEWFPEGAPALHASHKELIAEHPDLDAVLITTPDHTHEDLAVDFLEAGIAVFLEKPMAITTAGADRVLATAERTGTRLYIGHNMRHMPVVREMRRLVQEGVIGDVKAVWCRHFVGEGGDFYFKDWHADRTKTTGLLLQKGAHDLDVIHWLAGGYTREVSAVGGLTLYGDLPRAAPGERDGELMGDWWKPKENWPPTSLTGLNPVVDVEDISMLVGRLDNGVHVSYQQCHYTPDYWRNYTVIGTHGRLENFGDTGGEAEIRVWNARRSGYRADADLVVPIGVSEGGHGGADPALIDEFLGFVRDGGTTDTSPVAAREAVAVGVAATESLRDGSRPVRIAPVPEGLAGYFEGGQDKS
ncbi:oxidoreductase [Mangrovactinospora gilvigrisea]|uniref:Oxidoreductase n=2 Tax=Mangrovactinospora gilvigrisea TaxID=1428644 RepID=A0A1J7C8G2_9ACTN|nr:oxidoreductase [Mangrovactinospora gilvigrisea]